MTRALKIRADVIADVPRTAMVMAAGLGTRMRPLTTTRPKPLVEVAGKPLIDHVFDRLTAAGVEKVVVNVHYLADSLEAHLKSKTGLDVVISDERDLLLETGGGLVKAAPLIECDPFIAVNSDNFWVDGPADTIKLLAAHWEATKMDALLLLVAQAAPATTSVRAISTWTPPAVSAAAARHASPHSYSPASRSWRRSC